MKKMIFGTIILACMIAVAPMMNTMIAQDPVEGYVASLNEIVAGREGKVTKSVATTLMNGGNPLVFVSGNKVYLPINASGGNAAESIVNLAEVAKIGILGETKRVAGVNFIVVQKARPMR